MIRSSVVLPEPDGPSRATNSPAGDGQAHVPQGGKAPKVLLMSLDFDAHGSVSRVPQLLPGADCLLRHVPLPTCHTT